MNSDLAYLIGAYLGDGHCYINKNLKRYNYQFILATEDYDFCQICSDICKKYFDNHGKIKSIYKNEKFSHYKLVVCNKQLTKYLVNETSKKEILPDFKYKELNKSLIQGLMDADGWISRCKIRKGKYYKYSIGFKNTALWTPQFHKMFEKFNIELRALKYKNQVYRYDKKNKPTFSFNINVKEYIENIGFRIKRKKDLCNLYLKEITQPIEFNEKELRELYLVKRWSRKKLAKKYNCSESNIKKQLNKHGIRKKSI